MKTTPKPRLALFRRLRVNEYAYGRVLPAVYDGWVFGGKVFKIYLS